MDDGVSWGRAVRWLEHRQRPAVVERLPGEANRLPAPPLLAVLGALAALAALAADKVGEQDWPFCQAHPRYYVACRRGTRRGSGDPGPRVDRRLTRHL